MELLQTNQLNDLDSDIFSVKKVFQPLNGSDVKELVNINGENYMLKYQSFQDRADWTSYSNNIFNEHISCQIFKSLNIPCQDTYICKYNGDYAVACKIFTPKEKEFYELKALSTHPDVRVNLGRNIKFSDIYDIFYHYPKLNINEATIRFWDIFVTDAFLGNYDRHSGNIGFFVDKATGETNIAPVYDCASCLYPNLREEELLGKLMNDHKSLIDDIYTIPRSIYKDDNDVRVFYHEYLASNYDYNCTNALLRIFPKIDLTKIERIIDSTIGISPVRKDFYKAVVEERYKIVLIPAYEKLNN